MKESVDVCVVGSGAGGGPVAATLAEAGYEVLVLEKGPWYPREAFLKDEVLWCRRPLLNPPVEEEPQVHEFRDADGTLHAEQTIRFRKTSAVGGASLIMSGFFQRLKPIDFHLRSALGPLEGADVADWPISYDDLEPYYARAEEEVGVSGRVVDLPPHLADRRSTPDFPQGPTMEHDLAERVDERLGQAGLHPQPLPRAVLSERRGDRGACEYSGYCGSYGCTSGAKGSSLEAFLGRLLATGRGRIRPHAMVRRLESDATGRVVRAHWRDRQGEDHEVEARAFVVAGQAVETARLLLLSPGPRHPRGLANGSGQVGRNLLFSTYAEAWGELPVARYAGQDFMDSAFPFVNRTVQDHYLYRDEEGRTRKGGSLDILMTHPNPVNAGIIQALHDRVPDGVPVWGRRLKQRLHRYFHEARHVEVEVFAEWYPHADAHVTLDPHVRDRWDLPVARVRAESHPQSVLGARHLVARAQDVLHLLGCAGVREAPGTGLPSTNLVGGTCRFGDDPATSVLDRHGRAHEVENLWVSDGSFMPSGGSVPFTFTIVANALRVADALVADLGGPR